MANNRFDFIKQIINKNKNLGTTIDNQRYTLNDAKELVEKISSKKNGKNNAIKASNALVDKAEQISSLRVTWSWQKMLKIFNYLG